MISVCDRYHARHERYVAAASQGSKAAVTALLLMCQFRQRVWERYHAHYANEFALRGLVLQRSSIRLRVMDWNRTYSSVLAPASTEHANARNANRCTSLAAARLSALVSGIAARKQQIVGDWTEARRRID